jgi:hypothetical protein
MNTDTIGPYKTTSKLFKAVKNKQTLAQCANSLDIHYSRLWKLLKGYSAPTCEELCKVSIKLNFGILTLPAAKEYLKDIEAIKSPTTHNERTNDNSDLI